MALICYSCGKRAQRGNLVSHAKNRTKRKFGVNLHTYWITVRGKSVRAKFCTKCLRRVKASLKPKATPRDVVENQGSLP